MKTDSDWQLPNSVCLVNNHRIRLWVSCVAFELYLNKAAVKAKTYAITKSLCGLQRARDWGCFPAHHHLLFHLHSFQTFAEGLLLVKSYGGHLEIEQESAVPPSSHCSWGITHWTTGQEAARVLSGTLLWVVDWKHFFKKNCLGGLGSMPEQHTQLRHACPKGGVGQNVPRESPRVTNRKFQDIKPWRPRNGASLTLAFSPAVSWVFPFCLFVFKEDRSREWSNEHKSLLSTSCRSHVCKALLLPVLNGLK